MYRNMKKKKKSYKKKLSDKKKSTHIVCIEFSAV